MLNNKKFSILMIASLLVMLVFVGVMFFLIAKSGNDYGKVIHCREIECSPEDSEECFKRCISE